jgi:hypothetical protein
MSLSVTPRRTVAARKDVRQLVGDENFVIGICPASRIAHAP